VKIRRYYGYDCDSEQGFNNGYYVDDEPIEVDNHDEAFSLCRSALGERWDLSKFSEDDWEYHVDDTAQLITSYHDDEGNEITRDKFLELNSDEERGGYRYVFVNYEVISENEEKAGAK